MAFLIFGLDDGKFIATQARYQVGLAQAATQAQCDFFKEIVTDRVAQSIIDALEMVKMDVKDCELSSPPHEGEFLFELLAE